MSEWLGKPKPRLEDVKATHPSLVKDFPTIAAFFPEDQKLRVSVIFDHDEADAFRRKVVEAFGEFTADSARHAAEAAVRAWIGNRAPQVAASLPKSTQSSKTRARLP